MKNGTILVALLVATGVLVGLLGWLLLDDGPSTPSVATEKGRPGGKGGGGDSGGFRDSDFPSGAASKWSGGTGLTPEQEAQLRAALERIGNETAILAALTSDVPEPWPLPESQKRFGGCLVAVSQGLPTNRESAKEEICACATRALQRTYPKDPPEPGTRRGKKSVEASFRAALEECTNGP